MEGDGQTLFSEDPSGYFRRFKYNQWKFNVLYSFIFQRKVLHIAADSNVLKMTFFIYFIIAYPPQLSVGHWYTSGLSFGQIFQQLPQYSIAVISLSDHAPGKNNVH